MRVAIAALCAVVSSGLAAAQDKPLEAAASLKDAQGKPVGEATLTQTPAGLLLSATLHGLPAGAHAFHIHETAKCEPPGFKSAGGHYNPAAHQHGFENPKGAHAGDLPNVFVPASGEVKVELLSCSGAALDKLLAAGGGALVLHATGDDYHTDPAGAAGDRIACGVIVKK